MKKTIFIISPYENILTKRGNRHPFLAKLLQGKGYSISYISTNFYHAKRSHFSNDECKNGISGLEYELILKKNIGYKRLFGISRFISHIQFALSAFFELLNKKPDIIIIPSRPPELIFAISFLSFFKKFKIILDVRDTWPDAFPEEGLRKKIFSLYCNIFLIPSMRRIHHFLYALPSFITWIERYSKVEKAEFIPLGFDRDRWLDIRKPSVYDGIWKLIFVGNFSNNFNFNIILDAVGERDDIILTMVGGGENYNSVKEYVEKKMFSNIILTGFLEKEQVVERISNNHMTIIPMVGQSMPNKFFDSIGGERPILILGTNDASELIKKEKIGWALNFDDHEIINFFNGLSEEEYLERYYTIKMKKKNYSKEYLYRKIMELL